MSSEDKLRRLGGLLKSNQSANGSGSGKLGVSNRKMKKRRKVVVPKRLMLTEEQAKKKEYHFEKRLKQSIKQACKFEVRKISRRLAEAAKAEKSQPEVAKLQQQLTSAKTLDVDEVCKTLRMQMEMEREKNKEVARVSDKHDDDEGEMKEEGEGEGEGIDMETSEEAEEENASAVRRETATTATTAASGAPAFSESSEVVKERVVRHKCVRDALDEWKTGREKLSKQLELLEDFRLSALRNEKEKEERRAKRVHALPSQAAAFDSDRKSKEEKVQKKIEKNKNQPAKKRMGQRARRLLAEKKYGWQAKHLQVTPDKDHPYWRDILAEQETNTASDGGGQDNQTGGVGASKKSRDSAVTEQKLHPSWQAKKVVKEKMKINLDGSMSNSNASRKKTVFGEDGQAQVEISADKKGNKTKTSTSTNTKARNNSSFSSSSRIRTVGRGAAGAADKMERKGKGKAEAKKDLHPSWQLAKAKKLAQKKLTGTEAPRGKKIVFD